VLPQVAKLVEWSRGFWLQQLAGLNTGVHTPARDAGSLRDVVATFNRVHVEDVRQVQALFFHALDGGVKGGGAIRCSVSVVASRSHRLRWDTIFSTVAALLGRQDVRLLDAALFEEAATCSSGGVSGSTSRTRWPRGASASASGGGADGDGTGSVSGDGSSRDGGGVIGSGGGGGVGGGVGGGGGGVGGGGGATVADETDGTEGTDADDAAMLSTLRRRKRRDSRYTHAASVSLASSEVAPHGQTVPPRPKQHRGVSSIHNQRARTRLSPRCCLWVSVVGVGVVALGALATSTATLLL